MPSPASYCAAIATPTASVSTETARPTSLASAEPGRRGRKPTTAAPTSGTATRTVSQGKSFMPCPLPCPRRVRSGAGGARAASCEVHRQQGQDDEEDAAEQREGVGADEAVLHAPQLAGHQAHRHRTTGQGAVDAVPVEGEQAAHQAPAGPDHEPLV